MHNVFTNGDDTRQTKQKEAFLLSADTARVHWLRERLALHDYKKWLLKRLLLSSTQLRNQTHFKSFAQNKKECI